MLSLKKLSILHWAFVPILAAFLFSCAPYLRVIKTDLAEQQNYLSTNANGVELVISKDTIGGIYMSLVNNTSSEIFVGHNDVILKLDCCEMTNGIADWKEVVQLHHRLMTAFGSKKVDIAKNDELEEKGFPFGKIQPNTSKGGYIKLGNKTDETLFGTYDEGKQLATLKSKGNDVSKITLTVKITTNNGNYYLKIPLKNTYE